jgi:hypothetical protein
MEDKMNSTRLSISVRKLRAMCSVIVTAILFMLSGGNDAFSQTISGSSPAPAVDSIAAE